jgi:hypothetical protein
MIMYLYQVVSTKKDPGEYCYCDRDQRSVVDRYYFKSQSIANAIDVLAKTTLPILLSLASRSDFCQDVSNRAIVTLS